MVPVKWKLYVIINYVLIVLASVTFLAICVSIFGEHGVEREAAPYVIALGFFLLVIECIMNLIIHAKNFPHTTLTGNPFTIHVICIVFNLIVFLGLSFVSVIGMIVEFGEDPHAEDQTGKIVLAYCFLLWLLLAFISFCQLTLTRYLKKKNANLFTTMIDSIGMKTDEPQ